MTTTIYGQLGTRHVGHDWVWTDVYQTSDEVLTDVREDRVFNLDDPDYEQPDYGLRTEDGAVHIVVKAADALADML